LIPDPFILTSLEFLRVTTLEPKNEEDLLPNEAENREWSLFVSCDPGIERLYTRDERMYSRMLFLRVVWVLPPLLRRVLEPPGVWQLERGS
jgi:hypothetical protein